MFDLKELKRIRKRIGITQLDLAKRSGVSQSLIAKIESEKLDPSFSKAMKLLNTLNEISRKNEKTAFDIMEKRIISIKPDDNIDTAIQKMKKHEISQLPIIEDHKSIGIISESILLDAVLKHKEYVLVKDVMEDPAPIVSSTMSIDAISNLLRFYPLVLVSKKGMLEGVITKADIIQKAFH